nr:unnamed protein product [Callosobruchus chinensis]CAH7737051.1 unnamed protein product [Callosobruchus chinensis]
MKVKESCGIQNMSNTSADRKRKMLGEIFQ